MGEAQRDAVGDEVRGAVGKALREALGDVTEYWWGHKTVVEVDGNSWR